MFFNNDIKMQYLESLLQGTIDETNNSLVTTSQAIFNLTQPTEYSLNKDLGDFSKQDVINAIMYKKAKKARTLYTYCKAIRHYIAWYHENITHSHQKVDWDISTTEAQEIVAQYSQDVSRRNPPKILTKDFIDYWAEMQINPVHRFLILGAYNGVLGKQYCELSTIEESNLTEDGRLRVYKWSDSGVIEDRIIAIPNSLYYSIKDSCETYEIKSQEIVEGKIKSSSFAVYGDYAVKGTNKISVSKNEITRSWIMERQRIIRYRMDKVIVPDLITTPSLNDIYLSGLVNSIVTQAQLLGIRPIDIFSTPEISPILLRYGKQNQELKQVKFGLKEYL